MRRATAKERHANVAENFRAWRRMNPNADMREQVQKLNQLSDREFRKQVQVKEKVK